MIFNPISAAGVVAQSEICPPCPHAVTAAKRDVHAASNLTVNIGTDLGRTFSARK
jgi:hypothetical protein